MNTKIVQTVPEGNFVNISNEMADVENFFESMVSQRNAVKYRINKMPNLSAKIQKELCQQNYIDCILESDHWQHFLVPAPKQF